MQALAFASTPQAGRELHLRALFPLIREDAKTTWVHVAYEGEWLGHPAGPFTLSRDDFNSIVANFDAQANPIPLDYEHASEWANEAPAAGWVQKLEVREDDKGANLWALVELTDKAAEHIRAGEYRFTSGVFVFEATDRKTGDEVGTLMRSVALTNTPFVDGQVPLSLSQRAARAHQLKDTSMKFSKEALARALELLEADEISMEELQAAAQMAAASEGKSDEPEEASAPQAFAEEEPAGAPDNALPKSDEKPDEAKAAPTEDDEAEEVSAPATFNEDESGEDVAAPANFNEGEGGDAASMVLQSLLQATGLDAAGLLAALEERRDEIAELLTGALSDAQSAPLSDAKQQLTLSQAKSDALAAQLKLVTDELAGYRQAEEDKRVASAKAEVSELIEKGLLTEEKRQAFVKICLSDRASFDEFVGALKPVIPTGEHAVAAGVLRGQDKTTADAEFEPSDAEVAEYKALWLSQLNRTDEEKDAIARQSLRAVAEKKHNRRQRRTKES